jgi:hypothetical protein
MVSSGKVSCAAGVMQHTAAGRGMPRRRQVLPSPFSRCLLQPAEASGRVIGLFTWLNIYAGFCSFKFGHLTDIGIMESSAGGCNSPQDLLRVDAL